MLNQNPEYRAQKTDERLKQLNVIPVKAGIQNFPSLDGLRLIEEGMKGRVKISSNPPHPNPLPQGERGLLGNPAAELRGILLIKNEEVICQKEQT